MDNGYAQYMDILDHEAKFLLVSKRSDHKIDLEILKLLVKENHPVAHKNLYDIYLPYRKLVKLGIRLGFVRKDFFVDHFDVD